MIRITKISCTTKIILSAKKTREFSAEAFLSDNANADEAADTLSSFVDKAASKGDTEVVTELKEVKKEVKEIKENKIVITPKVEEVVAEEEVQPEEEVVAEEEAAVEEEVVEAKPVVVAKKSLVAPKAAPAAKVALAAKPVAEKAAPKATPAKAAPAAKPPVAKKTKATPFNRENKEHRGILTGIFTEINAEWKEDADTKAKAQEISLSCTEQAIDFLDDKGNVLPSFVEAVTEAFNS
jgi:hypothetical protein